MKSSFCLITTVSRVWIAQHDVREHSPGPSLSTASTFTQAPAAADICSDTPSVLLCMKSLVYSVSLSSSSVLWLCHLSISPCVYALTLCIFLHLSVCLLHPRCYLPPPLPPAARGPPQPSHSAHIFNSQLFSLPSPFLAAGHNKQNVRKQKLMSFFRESRGPLLRV